MTALARYRDGREVRTKLILSPDSLALFHCLCGQNNLTSLGCSAGGSSGVGGGGGSCVGGVGGGVQYPGKQ